MRDKKLRQGVMDKTPKAHWPEHRLGANNGFSVARGGRIILHRWYTNNPLVINKTALSIKTSRIAAQFSRETIVTFHSSPNATGEATPVVRFPNSTVFELDLSQILKEFGGTESVTLEASMGGDYALATFFELP